MRFYGQKKGFTLIELLVVIAIVALLLSIVLPALNAVKRRAKYIVCAANQGQIVKSMRVYAMENKDMLPGNWYHNNPDEGTDQVPTRWWPIMFQKMLPYWADGLDVVFCPGNNDIEITVPDNPHDLTWFQLVSYLYLPGLNEKRTGGAWNDKNPKAAYLRFGRNRGDFLIVADWNVWQPGHATHGGEVNHPRRGSRFAPGILRNDFVRAIEGGNRGHVDGSVSRAGPDNMGTDEQSGLTPEGQRGRYDHSGAANNRPYFF